MQRLILLAAVALALIGSIGVSAQTFNVKDYGATGDGTTDDSLAVAKACTALQASLTGGELFFPDGNYNLDNAHVESYIYITGQNSSLQYNVRGESTDSTILMPNLGASGFALITLNLLDPNVTSVSTHFSNFTVQLLAPSGNNFDAISFWAVVDSSIRGVNFNATGPVDSIFDINAYNNGSFADPRGIIFEDCNFSGTTRDSVDIEGPGISNIEFRRCSFSLDPSITPPFQVQGVRLGDRITNVVFDSCEFSGLNTGFVTYASSTTYEPSQKSITVISSSFYNTLIGIWINDNSTLTVASSFLSSSQSVSSTAIQSATAASQIQVVGNEVRGYGTAVMMQGGGTVQENTFTDNNAAFIFSGTGGFEFVQNVLDSNHNDVVITQGVGWVVEDNNCVGTLGSSSFICSSGPCINAGNIGCEFTTTEGDKKASEQIALA